MGGAVTNGGETVELQKKTWKKRFPIFVYIVYTCSFKKRAKNGFGSDPAKENVRKTDSVFSKFGARKKRVKNGKTIFYTH